jgi:hypothetical protein
VDGRRDSQEDRGACQKEHRDGAVHLHELITGNL